jgi:hypothetical protein
MTVLCCAAVLDFSQLSDDDRDATSKKQREAVGKRLKEVRASSSTAVLQALVTDAHVQVEAPCRPMRPAHARRCLNYGGKVCHMLTCGLVCGVHVALVALPGMRASA